jgi:hypothetical protein
MGKWITGMMGKEKCLSGTHYSITPSLHYSSRSDIHEEEIQ